MKSVTTRSGHAFQSTSTWLSEVAAAATTAIARRTAVAAVAAAAGVSGAAAVGGELRLNRHVQNAHLLVHIRGLLPPGAGDGTTVVGLPAGM